MRKLLIALPALLSLAGCGLLSAEFEIPSVSVTLKSQDFPAVPAGAPLVKEVNFPIGKDLTGITDKGVTFELRLTRMAVALAATSPMGDFGDIESVTVSVLPPVGQTLPEEAVIASYLKSPADPNPTSISVAGMSNLDLAPYILSGDLRLKFVAVSSTGGAIPAWKADVGGVFYLKVHADYLEALN
jgi:hypothetical protein